MTIFSHSVILILTSVLNSDDLNEPQLNVRCHDAKKFYLITQINLDRSEDFCLLQRIPMIIILWSQGMLASAAVRYCLKSPVNRSNEGP